MTCRRKRLFPSLINLYQAKDGDWRETAEAAEKTQSVREAGFIP